MKRALLLVAAVVLFSSVGCQSMRDPCSPGGLFCGGGSGADPNAPYHIGHPGLCQKNQAVAPPGPATPTYGYPYYTIRGPRDFLVDNPPSIGP